MCYWWYDCPMFGFSLANMVMMNQRKMPRESPLKSEHNMRQCDRVLVCPSWIKRIITKPHVLTVWMIYCYYILYCKYQISMCPPTHLGILSTSMHSSGRCTDCCSGHLQWGSVCPGECLLVRCLPRGCTPGGVCPCTQTVSVWGCLPGRCTPLPVDRILDTCLWKHYLFATTVVDGNKSHHFATIEFSRNTQSGNVDNFALLRSECEDGTSSVCRLP